MSITNVRELRLANKDPYFSPFDDDMPYFDGRKKTFQVDSLFSQIISKGSINAKIIA